MTRLETSRADVRPAAPAPRRTGTRIAWTFVLLLALGIVAFAAVPYFTASLDVLTDRDVGVAETYAAAPGFVQAALYAHIVGGAVALALGPFQFWRGLRRRAPRVHRWTGRLYLGGVALGGVGAIVMAPWNSAGWVGFFGFTALGALWLMTAWRAYRAIRRGDVRSHNAWVIRSFALTFSAVTLRLWLFTLLLAPLAIGMPWEFDSAFDDAYAALPFLAWLPNLIVAEWLIRRRGLPSYRLPATA